jgi:WD40 repeat protein
LIDSLVLLPNKRFVLSVSLDNSVILWDARV